MRMRMSWRTRSEDGGRGDRGPERVEGGCEASKVEKNDEEEENQQDEQKQERKEQADREKKHGEEGK